MRVGIGHDVHRLVKGRPLVLGGVHIPHDKGLLGHSDADVLTHAVCDALLGAAGLGDIGLHFPDTDTAYKAISSLALLSRVKVMVEEKGLAIMNIDTTVFAQAPKLSPFRMEMQVAISKILDMDKADVNIKFTTTEKLGFVGREEGIAADCIVLMKRS